MVINDNIVSLLSELARTINDDPQKNKLTKITSLDIFEKEI